MARTATIFLSTAWNLKNASVRTCSNTRWVSEEGGGTLSFLEGTDKAGQRMVAKSMRCTGKYCDNKQFTVCEVSEP
jgi:hypothetical protein